MNIKLLHKILIKKKLTISVAESCTGGLLAYNLTKLANSSKYFQMGLTTYSNKAKIKILKVNQNIIKKYGAVSEECCLSMLNSLMKMNKVSIALAITGIAGPKGGSLKKPVGLVYIGLKIKSKIKIKKIIFKKKNRIQVQKASANEALKLMLSTLSKN